MIRVEIFPTEWPDRTRIRVSQIGRPGKQGEILTHGHIYPNDMPLGDVVDCIRDEQIRALAAEFVGEWK